MGEWEKAICISKDRGSNFNVSTSINFDGGFRRSQLIVKTLLSLNHKTLRFGEADYYVIFVTTLSDNLLVMIINL